MTAGRRLVSFIGARMFTAIGRLLPGRVRRAKWVEIRTTFEDGLEFTVAESVWRGIGFVLRECGGLVGASFRGRWGRGGSAPRRPGPVKRTSAVSTIIQDLRFALRNLVRRPAAMGLAIGTFAVGVGASAAMFSVIDPVLLRPLPFDDPDGLVSVYPTIPDWQNHPTLGDRWQRGSFSWFEYAEWRERQTMFASAALFGWGRVTLTGDGEPERVPLGRATWELFPMLGVEPVVGRLFAPGEEGEVGAPALLLGESFWRRRFGGDTTLIGRTIDFGGTPHTVIGVLPSWFAITDVPAEGWVLFGDLRSGNPEDHSTRVIARLRDGVTREAAEAETAQILLSLSPPEHTQHGAFLVPRAEDITRTVRAPLVLLLAAAGVLLAVACANVATLLLGAGVEREEELAVRGALGAGRKRLIGQLVTENLLLAVLGGVTGVGLAYLGTDLLVFLAPPQLPRLELVSLNGRVVLFTALLSAGSGLLFGLVPAVSMSRTDVAAAMQGLRVRTAGRNRLQSGIVIVEMALATVLLVGAGLLTRTMINLNRVDPGFEAEGMLTVRIRPDFTPYFGPNAPEDGPERHDALYDEVRDALAGLPGVVDVALTTALPFSGDQGNNEIELEGYEVAEGELLLGERHYVSGNYPSLVGMRLREGRGFEPGEDRLGGPAVALVNTSLARHAWPGESALGKRLTFWGGEYTIIGVVDDVRDRSLLQSPGLQYFMPIRHRRGQSGSFVLRTTGDPLAVAPLVRERIWSVDPDVPVTSVTPMTQRVHGSIAQQRYRSRLVVAFSVLAAVMALLGVYGVTARSVSRRTREMGIRVALGAERRRLMSDVLGQGARLALLGAAVGLLGSVAATRVIEGFLYGTTGTDLVTLTGVAAAVALMSLVASLAPALRATRVDPMVVLRDN